MLRCGSNSKSVLSEHMLWMIFRSTSCEVALKWLSVSTFDDKSTLLQVMAWCRQATSQYLKQCWLRFMSPEVVTGPQWVKWVPYVYTRCLGTILPIQLPSHRLAHTSFFVLKLKPMIAIKSLHRVAYGHGMYCNLYWYEGHQCKITKMPFLTKLSCE